jgi:hypothetical protein
VLTPTDFPDLDTLERQLLVHLAFDELLANAVDARSTPTTDPRT